MLKKLLEFPDLLSTTDNTFLHASESGFDKKVPVAAVRTSPLTTNATAALLLLISHSGKTIVMTNAAAKTVTLPVSFLPNYSVRIVNGSNTPVTINPAAGVLVDQLSVPIILKNYGDSAVLLCVEGNNYICKGEGIRSYVEISTMNFSGSFQLNATTLGGQYAVQWWDNTVSLHNSGTTTSKLLDGIENQKKIRVFAAGGIMSLTVLPDMVVNSLTAKNMDTLAILYCTENELLGFTTEGMPNLQQLYLQDNLIASVNLIGLRKLQILNLSSNPGLVSLLPDGLDSLITLNMRLTGITSFSGAGFSRLTTLTLGGDLTLASFSGVGMPALDDLTLNGVGLTYLDTSGLYMLRRLEVYAPSLETLDCRNLERIDQLFCTSNSVLTSVLNFPKANRGLVCNIDFTGCALNTANINAIFTAVGIPSGSLNLLTFTSNPGADAATESIATLKGWTTAM